MFTSVLHILIYYRFPDFLSLGLGLFLTKMRVERHFRIFTLIYNLYIKENEMNFAIAILVFLTSPAFAAIDSKEVKKAVLDIATQFRQKSLTVETATAALPEAKKKKSGKFTEISSANLGIRCSLGPIKKGSKDFDVSIKLELDSGLILEDLTGDLGQWQEVYASKESSVKFEFQGDDKETTFIYAKLFTPKPSGKSPVTTLTMRRAKRPN